MKIRKITECTRVPVSRCRCRSMFHGTGYDYPDLPGLGNNEKLGYFIRKVRTFVVDCFNLI